MACTQGQGQQGQVTYTPSTPQNSSLHSPAVTKMCTAKATHRLMVKSACPGHTPGPSCLSHTPSSHHTRSLKDSSQCPSPHGCSAVTGLPARTKQLSSKLALLLAGPVAHLCLVVCPPIVLLATVVQHGPTAEEMRQRWGKPMR